MMTITSPEQTTPDAEQAERWRTPYSSYPPSRRLVIFARPMRW